MRLSLSDLESSYKMLCDGLIVFRRDRGIQKRPVWNNANFVQIKRDFEKEHIWNWEFYFFYGRPVFIVNLREFLGINGYEVSIKSITVNNIEICRLDKSKSLSYYLNEYGNKRVLESSGRPVE